VLSHTVNAAVVNILKEQFESKSQRH